MSDEQNNNEVGQWPIWKTVLNEMRLMPGFGYGLTLDTPWFEARFGVDRDSNAFAFEMLELRQTLESEDGYYLQSQTIQDEESSIRKEVWQIPSAADHGAMVATGFRKKGRNYMEREARILSKTLTNPTAKLGDSEKAKMESQERIAATRLVLLRREKSIATFLHKNAPKLLGK